MKYVVGAIVSIALFGCAHVPVDTNVPNSEAPVAFGYIGPLASSEGYRIYPQPDRLHIRYSDAVEIQFVADRAFSADKTMKIRIIVDDELFFGADAATLKAEAEIKAREWLSRAEDAMVAKAAAPDFAPEASPALHSSARLAMQVSFGGPKAPPSADAAAIAAIPGIVPDIDGPGMCRKLANCYSSLENLLCKEGDAKCAYNNLEVANMAESDCSNMVTRTPNAIRKNNPELTNFELPAMCL